MTHPDGLPFAPSDALLSWGLAERRAGRGEVMWSTYAERYTAGCAPRTATTVMLGTRCSPGPGSDAAVLLPRPNPLPPRVLATLLTRCGAVYEGER